MDNAGRFALGMPSALLVEITSHCNLKCRMCPLTARRTPSGLQPGHMSDAVWKCVLAFATGVRQVMIGGYGEPLANPRCIEYLRELDAAGVPTSLTTNGTLVTDRIAADLSSLAHFTGANVSIDSPDPSIYREIRGGDLQRAFEGARRLAAALDPSKVTVSSVMMRTTIETLSAFPDVLARLGVKKYVLQGLIDYTRDVEDEEMRRRNGLADRVASIERACQAAGVELSFALPDRVATELGEVGGSPAAERTGTNEAPTKQCAAPWEVPVIDKDGRVFPCCYALSNATAVLGDLREASPEDVWFGDQYEQFRHDLLDGRTTPAVCRSCTVVPAGPHPLARYSAQILPEQPTVTAGGQMTLLVRNLGNAAWTERDRVLIGTTDPRDRASALHHSSWIGLNRITSFSDACVEPGAVATFEARIARSTQADETFQLVVENRCWVPGTRFRISPPAEPARTERAWQRLRGRAERLRVLFGDWRR